MEGGGRGGGDGRGEDVGWCEGGEVVYLLPLTLQVRTTAHKIVFVCPLL